MNQNLSYNEISAFSAKGRFGRLSYMGWSFLLSLIFCFIVITFASLLDLSNIETSASPLATLFMAGTFYVIYFYFIFVFTIRRLHDCNTSGWLSLLLIVPLLNIIFCLYLMIAKGDEGHNNYGPARQTRTWEKVLGIIYIILPILGLLLAVTIPAYQNYIHKTSHAQIEKN